MEPVNMLIKAVAITMLGLMTGSKVPVRLSATSLASASTGVGRVAACMCLQVRLPGSWWRLLVRVTWLVSLLCH